jgi:hypothetical protein
LMTSIFVSTCSWGRSPGRAERNTNMCWECSECGGYVERVRPPVQCRECGTAGAIFVPVEVDPVLGDPEADSLRAVWLHAGLKQGRLTRAA